MKIFAIGDLHLDSKNEKPMNIFGDNWSDHEQKIFSNWNNTVGEQDVVLIPGDVSWAIKLEDAKIDLLKIDKLPGTKIICKGNHDFWWSTNNKLSMLGLKTIKFLKNNYYEFGDYLICGTRGWDSIEENIDELNNERIYTRELNRLKLSLESFGKSNKCKIVMLHYPPFDRDGEPNEFFDILKSNKVNICIYGHLHGEEGHKNIKEGHIEHILFHCVSSDYLDFKLKHINV
ncbi:MAG: metallophosphoesterase [Tissierellia bacterium]|nr:metallophosphoesterase [Tissierellia bacterium]